MLFGYPAPARDDNWFHECIYDALHEIHRLADAKQAYPKWPAILPGVHQAALVSRAKLDDLFKAYDGALRGLTKANRALVLHALVAQNRVSDLLSNVSNAEKCIRFEQLPKTVQGPVAKLFEFAYTLLDPLQVRSRHYLAIHAAMHTRIRAHVCPFCGVHHFCSPSSGEEAMDHYLARSIYPFVAVNLSNLVPMCHECNSGYKRQSDMIRSVDGKWRMAFDPYNHAKIEVRLDQSVPFGGRGGNVPEWKIEFLPKTSEVETWDEVFKISLRYRNDLLDEEYEMWIDMFRDVVIDRVTPYSDQKLIQALLWYEDTLRPFEFQSVNFLKLAVFRMLRLHCARGDIRVLRHLQVLISSSTATP